jgi:hypothetical protein
MSSAAQNAGGNFGGGPDRYRTPGIGPAILLHPVPVSTGRYWPLIGWFYGLCCEWRPGWGPEAGTGGFMLSSATGLSVAVRAGAGGRVPACTTPRALWARNRSLPAGTGPVPAVLESARISPPTPSPMKTHRVCCPIIYVQV